MARFNPHVASPVLDVVWAGWRSSSVALQRQGWEFAMSDDPYGGLAIEVVMRHRDTGFVGWGQVDLAAFHHGTEPPVLVIRRVRHDSTTLVIQQPLLDFHRVDMTPHFVDVKQLPFSALGIFRPWHEGKEELIVEPDDVNTLMERIRKLQEPELKQIRERNRRREGAKEQVLAQVICLAA